MPTRPDLIFGVNNRHPASVGTTTNALGTVLYEEQATGSNGFGQRMAVRHYETSAANTWLAGSDPVVKFNGGRMVVASVSGSYVLASHDSDWNALFDRMYALDFGGTDTSGAGTKKPLIAPLCLYHEVDVPAHGVNAAAYVTAFKHIRTLRNARAAAAGVDASHVPLMTIFTAYGINIGRATPYWPGNDQVDIFGVDGYSGLGGGSWTEPASIFTGVLTFSTAHGDKDVWICETSVKAETGHDVGTWWSNYAALVAAKPQIKAVFAFQGAPGDTVVNFDKVGNPLKHAGMQAFLTTTGATAGYGSVSSPPPQLPPSSPSGVTFTSDASGTFGTVTWAANPSGDNVTLWDVYMAPGKVTSGFVRQNSTSLPASPRSYTITGLTPGSPYTFTAVAINSAGRSGFGTMFQGVTSKPGPTNQAPIILGFSADVDSTDPTLVHFTSSASDPNGDALTYTIAVAGTSGFTATLTGPNADANFDPGVYSAALSVSDGTLTTTQVVQFRIVVLPLVTANFGWPLMQPGDNLRDATEVQRQTYPDIDDALWALLTAKNSHNTEHGFAASTFDPALASTTKTTFAAGDVRWYPMLLQSSTINGLIVQVTDAQIGTGTQFCVHDATGVQMCSVQSGSTVDTALQSVSPAGGTVIPLDSAITGLTAGGIVFVGVLVGGTTAVRTYVGPAASVMGQVNLAQGFWRGNVLAAQSTYPDVLPFSSASVAMPAFFAFS